MRFCSLASGSRGNALLVEHEDTLILVDCGLAVRTLQQRLRSIDRELQDIAAILVTHEHSDHVSGVAALSRRIERPVFATHGTARALEGVDDLRSVRYGRSFTIGNVSVQPFPVPHDAREPAQYRFDAGDLSLGVLTDTGHISAHVAETLASVDALAVEFNHDLEQLNNGPYPDYLKARVGSRLGHLNNDQAAGLLSGVDQARLRWVVALHMSEKNNSPDHVRRSVAPLCDTGQFDFWQATQGEATDWFELS